MDDAFPQPQFSVGDRVRVRLNAQNRTPREGIIVSCGWHRNGQYYYYYLIEQGKTVLFRKVAKRYPEADLERMADHLTDDAHQPIWPINDAANERAE